MATFLVRAFDRGARLGPRVSSTPRAAPTKPASTRWPPRGSPWAAAGSAAVLRQRSCQTLPDGHLPRQSRRPSSTRFVKPQPSQRLSTQLDRAKTQGAPPTAEFSAPTGPAATGVDRAGPCRTLLNDSSIFAVPPGRSPNMMVRQESGPFVATRQCVTAERVSLLRRQLPRVAKERPSADRTTVLVRACLS